MHDIVPCVITCVLQASLVSLRKIVNKFEKRDDDDKVARLEQEKASLESKNGQLANSLRVNAHINLHAYMPGYLRACFLHVCPRMHLE